MAEWWNGLSGLNQWFFFGAFVFSALFLWQLVAALIGLGQGGDADVTSQVDTTLDHSAVDNTAAVDAQESLLT
ncbi:MAG: hypothetical protein EHM48_05800, partial [Planctomycetaceae bacterium]